MVTGAAAGLGEAIAERLHAEGARLVAFDISGGEHALAMRLGARCLPMRGDVADESDVRAAVAAALEEFGSLDILVNNAGTDGDLGPVATCTLENFDRVIGTNVRGTFLGIKYAIPALLESGGGSIITISSAAGLVATPGLGVYCASKAAVSLLTRTVAAEYSQRGIRANVICPGVIHTPQFDRTPKDVRDALAAQAPIGRIGTPAEIAAAVAFLASDEASYITGATLSADGGMVA